VLCDGVTLMFRASRVELVGFGQVILIYICSYRCAI